MIYREYREYLNTEIETWINLKALSLGPKIIFKICGASSAWDVLILFKNIKVHANFQLVLNGKILQNTKRILIPFLPWLYKVYSKFSERGKG